MTHVQAFVAIHFCAATAQAYLLQSVARTRSAANFLFIFCVSVTSAAVLIGISAAASPSGFFEASSEAYREHPFLLLAVFAFSGFGYAALTFGRLRAQVFLPAYVAASLSRLSIVIVAMVSIAVLGESTSIKGMAGIGLALVPLVLLGYQSRQHPDGHRRAAFRGIVWALLAAACASGLQLLTKTIVDPSYGVGASPLLFALGSNVANTCVSGVFVSAMPVRPTASTVRLGFASGLANVVAVLSLSLALQTGKASMIYPVSALSIVPASAIMFAVGRERRPTLVEIVCVVMSMVSIVLLLSEVESP